MSVKAYKGFDRNLRCRGFQYEVGKEYETDRAEVCEAGFHACESPLDVWKFYPPVNGNRFCEVEQGGDIKLDGEKTASTKLKIGAEIGISGLAKAHIEYTRHKAASGKDGGNWSNLAGGYRSNLAGGSGSNLAGGESSICVVRDGGKAKGGLHSVIVLTNWKWEKGKLVPDCVKTVVIDGETYKPDTWYTLKNGEVVEVEEEK